MSRIYSDNAEKPTIDQDAVLEFFEIRARKTINYDINYKQAVIYQDKNPELAEARDHAEKALLIPKLNLSGRERFLDIGCGTGRWLESVHDQISYYHGIDVSSGLIEIAKKKFEKSYVRFTCLRAENLNAITLCEKSSFDRILNVGVMMYLNEHQLEKYLSNIPDMLIDDGLVVVREPIALEKRLTLNSYYSDDMNQNYSAIYRTESELLQLMNKAFKGKLILIESDFVFKEDYLNNRLETRMKYFIFKFFNK